MQKLLEYFITQSFTYSLGAVALVTFLESLAIVGLILPGSIIMAGFGALISNGKIIFWKAWITGIFGCLFGDWISLWLGWYFKKSIYQWSFMKKNEILLNKTERALHKHSTLTILAGRFIGPTRPLIPIVAGILNLPIAKFIIPNIIGCIFWPPLYFLPGILAGATLNLSTNEKSNTFKWLLFITILLLWRFILLCCRLWNNKKGSVYLLLYLSHRQLILVAFVMFSIIIIMITVLFHHPLMPIYSSILLKIIK